MVVQSRKKWFYTKKKKRIRRKNFIKFENVNYFSIRYEWTESLYVIIYDYTKINNKHGIKFYRLKVLVFGEN